MTDQDDSKPPEGFEVMRESDLDPERGRSTHWLYRGRIGERCFIRPGYGSRAAACQAAWFIFRMVRPDDERVSEHMAERAARRREQRREREQWRRRAWVDPPTMREVYMVRLDVWEIMVGDLLAQIIEDAGSLRRASIVIGVPRSTLSARVRAHRERGTWPT